jgi:3-hydroxyisobutyrate dehydrogenase-like beta-hydroxyacid dehydrogenase
MARNLSESSEYPLVVHNRTVSKSAQLAKETNGRVIVADSIADLVGKCDVIFTNLANDSVVKTVYGEMVDALHVRDRRTFSTAQITHSLIGNASIAKQSIC